MADRSDRDILIAVETTVIDMKTHLKKINDQVDKNRTAIGCLQSCEKWAKCQIMEIKERPTTDEATNVRLVNLEKRPNAVKAVLAVGAIVAMIMTVFGFWKG